MNLVVRMMLAHNAQHGWRFDCPGPEIPFPDGGHTHEPRWVGPDGQTSRYVSQMARGIVFPTYKHFLYITSSRDGWSIRRKWLLARLTNTRDVVSTIQCACGASHRTSLTDATLQKWVEKHGHHMPALPDEPPEHGNLLETDEAGNMISLLPAIRHPDGRIEVVEQVVDGPPSPSSGELPAEYSATCHDCEVHEGQLHEDLCDMERCPFCGGQLLSCDCANRHFYPNSARDYSLLPDRFTRSDRAHAKTCQSPDWSCTVCAKIEEKGTWGLPASVYFRGLHDEQQAEWNRRLEAKGRVPFISYPSVCCRCGDLWPDFFMVPDEEWEKYVEPAQRGNILCRPCFDWIKRATDEVRAAS
jgi:hypothetical protein